MPINVAFDEIRKKRVEKRFNKWLGPVKSRLKFNEWLDLFGKDCNSFNKIAIQIGCSRENISQLYQKYFARLLPNRPNGRSRQKICTFKRIEIKKRDFSNEISEPLNTIVHLALSKGYKVKKIPIFCGNSFLRTQTRHLLINGKKCKIHELNTNKWGREYGYNQLFVSKRELKKDEFLLIIRKIEDNSRRVFIIPTAILLDGLEKKYKWFYVPLEKRPVYNNHRPKIDFWQFLDAWHLLESI